MTPHTDLKFDAADIKPAYKPMTDKPTFQAPQDFLEECKSIEDLINSQSDLNFAAPTLFKAWTIGDIIGHLHLWNIAADLALTKPDAFQSFMQKMMGAIRQGQSHQALQADYFGGKSDREIYADWRGFYPEMTARFAASDAARRVKWVGPDMSVASSIIARQMEHWSHAQAIFDVFGRARVNTDRLKNVVHIGVTTYSWSFKVNELEPLKPKPYLRLTAPSGRIWEWNDPQEDNRIDGPAEDFAQVVTQCRNIADTALVMTGPTSLRLSIRPTYRLIFLVSEYHR